VVIGAGVVIGALKLPDHKYLERRIRTSSFQPPNFENKRYLDDAVKIAEEIVKSYQPSAIRVPLGDIFFNCIEYFSSCVIYAYSGL